MNNVNKFEITERTECSADTKLFFDDVYKSDTRGKKQQVDVLQYGRSMIEMLGVLAIVGVLSVGGIAGYSKAMEKFKINKTIDQVSHIVANIRTLYAQQTTYNGLGSQNAIKMGVIPDGLTTSNSAPYITNVFKEEIYIETNTKTYGNGGGSFMIATQVPKEVCTALATYDWGKPSSSGLISMAISSSSYISSGWFTMGWDYKGAIDGEVHFYGSKFLPLQVAEAATLCSSCQSDNCSIAWEFK